MRDDDHPDALLLTGLDPADPLGFLAALGTLAACARAGLAPRMSWTPRANGFRPRVWLTPATTDDALSAKLVELIAAEWRPNGARPAYLYNDVVAVDRARFRALSSDAAARATTAARGDADFFAGFASDGVTLAPDKERGVRVQPSQLSFANGNGMRWLFDNYEASVTGKHRNKMYKDTAFTPLTAERLHGALFGPFALNQSHQELRWSPTEYRPGALSRLSGTNQALNALAFWGLTLLPSAPLKTARGRDGKANPARSLGTVGVNVGDDRRAVGLTWPVWSEFVNVDVVRSLLALDELQEPAPDATALRARGVIAAYRSERFTEQKCYYFRPAVAV